MTVMSVSMDICNSEIIIWIESAEVPQISPMHAFVLLPQVVNLHPLEWGHRFQYFRVRELSIQRASAVVFFTHRLTSCLADSHCWFVSLALRLVKHFFFLERILLPFLWISQHVVFWVGEIGVIVVVIRTGIAPVGIRVLIAHILFRFVSQSLRILQRLVILVISKFMLLFLTDVVELLDLLVVLLIEITDIFLTIFFIEGVVVVLQVQIGVSLELRSHLVRVLTVVHFLLSAIALLRKAGGVLLFESFARLL